MPKAETLNVAYATYERAGCYACHKTQGLRYRHPEARPDPHEDRLEADAGLGEDLDPQSARGEADDVDAALLVQLEQQRARGRRAERGRDQRASSAYLFANAETYELAVKSPPRGDAKSGEEIVKSIGCLGCHVVGERHARRGRPAPDLRPAAREHRQQDHLRVDLQLGARSEALQPGDLHAEPAADRRAGGRRRDLPVGAEGAGRRRGEGDARSEGGRRRAARLPEGA